MGFFMGAASLLGVVALGSLMAALSMGSPFLVVVMVINALGCFSWSVYSFRLFSKTLPRTVVLLDEDENDLARQFPGCKTLDDVVYITGLDSKEDLLQKLTSTKPEDMVELMQRVDGELVAELLGGLGGDDSTTDNSDSEDGRTELMSPVQPKHAAANSADSCWWISSLGRTAANICNRRRQLVDATNKPEVTRSKPKHADPEPTAKDSQDKDGLWQCMLTTRINVLEKSWADFSATQSDEDSIQFEKDFDTLMPASDLAKLLKERPELKGFVIQATKLLLKKKASRIRAKFGM